MKSYINDHPEGQAAFNDLRAETLDSIKNKAFIGPEDAQGNRALSRDALERELRGIGRKKLEVLYTPKEVKFLEDMLHVAKLREPVRGTQQGAGPSAQAIGKLEKKLKEVPMLGALVNFIAFDAQGRAVLKAAPKRIEKEIPRLTKDIGAATSVSAIPYLQEEAQ